MVSKPGVKRQVANGQIRDRDDGGCCHRSNEQLLRTERALHRGLLWSIFLVEKDTEMETLFMKLGPFIN